MLNFKREDRRDQAKRFVAEYCIVSTNSIGRNPYYCHAWTLTTKENQEEILDDDIKTALTVLKEYVNTM